MKYELLKEEDGIKIYARIDDDGLVRVTAIEGYEELDEYLALLKETKPESELSEAIETPVED
jgi:hypothetical protein